MPIIFYIWITGALAFAALATWDLHFAADHKENWASWRATPHRWRLLLLLTAFRWTVVVLFLSWKTSAVFRSNVRASMGYRPLPGSPSPGKRTRFAVVINELTLFASILLTIFFWLTLYHLGATAERVTVEHALTLVLSPALLIYGWVLNPVGDALSGIIK